MTIGELSRATNISEYTSIYMWLKTDKLSSEYFALKDIIQKQFKN